MLLANRAIGIEINPEEVKFVLVGGKRTFPRLDACVTTPFPGETIHLSTKEPNILNPAAFVATVREGYLRLLTDVKRVSVSLPDSVGRVMLLDFETRFKSRDEGRDIIRWKLKKTLPIDVNEVHVDYQILRERETGEISTLVAVIPRQVLNQYEDLLLEAGLEANPIDFTAFNRYSLFSERLELSEYSAYITYYGKTVGILIFNGGILEFYRSKEMTGTALDADRLFREINSSLIVYRERFPGHGVTQVFCSASQNEAEIFGAVVTEATGLEPVFLDVERVVGRRAGLTIDKRSLSLLSAALGAAARNL